MKRINYEQAMTAFFNGAVVSIPNFDFENSSMTKYRFIIYKGSSEYAFCTATEIFTADHFTGPRLEVLPEWCRCEYASDNTYYISDEDYKNIIQPIKPHETQFYNYQELKDTLGG